MIQIKDNPQLKAALIERRRQGQYEVIRKKFNIPQGILVETFIEEEIKKKTEQISKLINLKGYFLTKDQFYTFESYLTLLKINIFVQEKSVPSYYVVTLRKYQGTLVPDTLLDSKLYTVYRTQKTTIKNFK